MRDPIEGQFRVVGEQQPYEPIVSNWPLLLGFVGLFALAVFLKAEQFKSEARDRLRESARDTGWRPTAEQAATSGTPLQHQPQHVLIGQGSPQ